MKLSHMVVIGLLLGACPAELFAYKTFLDDNTIVPQTQGSQRRLTIKNDEDKPIAVQISMYSRDFSETGEEKNAPVPKQWFKIYPTQLVIEPGEEETVRIAWTNPIKIEKESAFRVKVEQIKIDENDNAPEVTNDSVAKVTFLTNYMDALYIKPKGAIPKVIFRDPVVVEKQGNRLLSLQFENQGNARMWMPDLSLKIQPLKTDGSIDTSQKVIEMPNVAFVTLMPDRKQIVQVPLPGTAKSQKFAVEYTYKKL